MIQLMVDGLAAYRLTRLVVDDEITSGLRETAYRVHPKCGYLVNCPHCTGVWASAAIASGLVPDRVKWGLALAALVSLYYDASHRLG